jgi:hypothetical protein
MTTELTPPTGWIVETERTTYDDMMGREYTTILYREEATRRAVYIHEIIDAENVWRYIVHRSGPEGNLGTSAELATAKEIAFEFMNDVASSA